MSRTPDALEPTQTMTSPAEIPHDPSHTGPGNQGLSRDGIFSLIWILVFVAMVASRFTEGPPVTWRQFLLVGIGAGYRFGDLDLTIGHRFGDLTIRIGPGEIWRLVTCNFVHYSLIHILLNIVAFYLLGTMIESWYGSWQFIFIYLLTGSLGNLLSALGRQAAFTVRRSTPRAGPR